MAYAGLTIFSFFLAGPQDWTRLVSENRILPEYVDYIAAIPTWAVALTVVAAATRFAGAIGLLLKQRWSTWVYSLSLVCIVIIMFRGFVLADVANVIRASQIALEFAFLGLSLFAVWFSAYVTR